MAKEIREFTEPSGDVIRLLNQNLQIGLVLYNALLNICRCEADLNGAIKMRGIAEESLVRTHQLTTTGDKK